MARHHATPEGNVPFTAEEEKEWDADAAEWVAGANNRKAADVRTERAGLLSETDWMGCSDVTITDEWETYRQALRDITDQPGFPDDVTFPEKPTL